jgi:uncharacterized protein YkwD
MYMSITFIDVLLAALVALCVWQGWRRGFIHGLLDLLRWVCGMLAGLRFHEPLARAIGPHVGWDEVWDRPVAFLLAATAAGLAVQLLGYALLRRLPEGTHERRANKLLGTLPGLASGLVVAAIAASLLLTVPLPDSTRESVRDSSLANRLAAQTERLELALRSVFTDAVAQTLNRLMTVRPGSDERVELPFKVTQTRPRPDLEAQMLALVNRERAAAGLRPVAPDPEMTSVARAHSADMFARGYFAHQTPEGLSPFDRMTGAGVVYRTAGENLALAPTLHVAHTGLMNSPGHRANILQPSFGRLGIGILDGGRRGLMVTQNFRN